ncbi:histidine phosphatase superfamily [Mrakia frigida]|uniref:histidine phosphatase family protein n=1 Tax=Mrakia frigida TaxID=29902 RepID=UPI003FCC0EEA
MAPLILTIVRHAQSVDNTKMLFSGSTDTPLSELGVKQAQAVGDHFKDLPISHIFASPLIRARHTAEQIQQQNLTVPRPKITFSPLFQEQFWGDYEGLSVFGREIKYSDARHFRFPGGESLDDVAARAEKAVDQFLLPYILETASSTEPQHILVVAHGIFNPELIGALMRRRASGAGTGWQNTGSSNTGWTRLEIKINDPTHPSSSPRGHPTLSDSNPRSIAVAPAPTLPTPHPNQPKLDVKILLVNQTGHLKALRAETKGSSRGGASSIAGGGGGEGRERGGARL